MNIVLTGFMASGKTEISKAIAELSNYSLLDTDDMITERAGMSINEIFKRYGEDYFRKLERGIVSDASRADKAVIATGGGVVLDKENMSLLRKNGVIFNLAPDFSVIRGRIDTARKTRPLMQNESIGDIEKRFNDRLPFYADCDYKIKVINGRSPRSYAMEILELTDKKIIPR